MHGLLSPWCESLGTALGMQTDKNVKRRLNQCPAESTHKVKGRNNREVKGLRGPSRQSGVPLAAGRPQCPWRA